MNTLIDQEIQDLSLNEFYTSVINSKYSNEEVSRITFIYLHFIIHRLEEGNTIRLLNDIFKHTYSFSAEQLNTYYLIALLRKCSCYKAHIDYWDNVLKLTKQCCTNNLLDYRKELWGLYKNCNSKPALRYEDIVPVKPRIIEKI